ncbi:RNA-binding protein 41-like [Saccostrea echinata]|uniref:RNA-binding protein 41-like n=1 Tax=Saccostrea echinata TaxID=191078 RepID=UPI002A7EFF39|nr:RNA-binding protein 41-like [Saccostrea echinata]
MDVSLQKKRWRPEIAPPTEEIVTEGQKQLKTLLDKQLQKDVTIQQQLAQKRTFTSASAHCPAVNSLSGLTSLDHFQEVDKLDTYTEELKKCGLTEEEIQIKMMADDSHKSQKKRNFGINPLILDEKLKKIEEKIEKKMFELNQRDKIHGQKTLTRHEMELERSLLRDCTSDDNRKVIQALTTVQDPRETTLPKDPMNHLPEILEKITRKPERHKGRKNKPNDLTDNSDVHCQVDKAKYEFKDSSGSVLEDKQTEVEFEEEFGEIATCEPRPLTPVPEVSMEDIQKNKLTTEEIKMLPKFGNYHPGDPSKVLYLKNLSGKVHQQDLESLFKKFQKEGSDALNYRVMKGKMKGQAFITFPDIDTASYAMECVNGYNLKGKPIIIQFGRNSPSSQSAT